MKKEFDLKNDAAIEIAISVIPNEINMDEIVPEQNKCIDNSRNVALHNENVEVIEGIGIIIDKEQKAHAFPHAWNRLGQINFDVTIGNPDAIHEDIVECKYLITHSYDIDDVENNVFLDFTDTVVRFTKEINERIKK